MTLTAPTETAVVSATPPSPPRSRTAFWCAASLAVAAAAGAALLVAADRTAEWGGSPYDLFWLGLLAFTVPAVWWAGRAHLGDGLRLAVLLGYAGFTYLPKLLRNPSGPLYHDEFAHWRQSREILLDGRLFEPNPIVRVIGDFPGLHATVAGVSALTGLTVWHAALIVLVAAHVLAVLGVYVLAEELRPDRRAAAVAAVIYSLNSSFLFFDTQFGYESLAVTLYVWTLAALLRTMRASGARSRAGWAAVTLLLAASTILTHHLTALGLIATMVIVALVATARAGRTRTGIRSASIAWLLTVTAAAFVAAWLVWVAPRTASYLDPYLGRAINQFAGMAGAGGSGGRTLFQQTVTPWWEQSAAFAAPVIAFAAMALAGLRLWRRRAGDPVTRVGSISMYLLGLCYFPASLLILTPSGAEGGRRSWAFSYLGIAIVVAPVVVSILNRAGPPSADGALGRYQTAAGSGKAARFGLSSPAAGSGKAARFGLSSPAAESGTGARSGLSGRFRFLSVGAVLGRLHSRGGLLGLLPSFVAGGALIVLCVIVLIGNTAAGMNPSYRFPGPPAFGSDTRAATPEVLAAADWLRRTQGRGLRMVADRYSGLIFGSYGDEDPVTGSVTFPTYDVYLAKPGAPAPAVVGQLSAWNFGYLVVDRRMATEVPDIQIYFESDEPIAHNGLPAFTLGQLTKFDHLPWTIKIYDSGDIAIYRFDFSSLNAPVPAFTPAAPAAPVAPLAPAVPAAPAGRPGDAALPAAGPGLVVAGRSGAAPAVHPVQPPAARPVQPPAVRPVQPPAARPVQPAGAHPGLPAAGRPGVVPAARPPAEPAARPGVGPGRPAAGRPGARPGAGSAARPGRPTVGHSLTVPGARPGHAAAVPSGAAPDVLPGGMPAARPGGAPDGRPVTSAAGRPAAQPGATHAAQPSGAPAIRPGAPATRPGAGAARPGAPAIRPGAGAGAVRPGIGVAGQAGVGAVPGGRAGVPALKRFGVPAGWEQVPPVADDRRRNVSGVRGPVGGVR